MNAIHAVKIKKEILVFDCGIKDHFHKKKTAAENCVRKQQVHQKALKVYEDSRQRDLFMLCEAISGVSYADISKRFGIGKERTRQLIHRGIRRIVGKILRSNNFDHSKVPPHNKINEIRANKDYWLQQTEILKNKVKI